MRTLSAVIAALLLVLMLVVYFQNYSIGAHQQLYFLTSSQSTNSANALFYAYCFGILTSGAVLLFLTGGKIDVTMPHRGKEGEEEEWK